MSGRLPKDILEKINQAWSDYKAKTGATQAQVAKRLGIKQSAFSQYLRGPDRGGIPLNTDFIVKFAHLLQLEFTEFGLDCVFDDVLPTAYTLEIKYTLSGATLKDKYCPVQSIVPHRNCYAVLVDIEGFIMHKGAIIIVDPDEDIHENDGVICRSADGPLKVGQIVYAQDAWRIVSPIFPDVFAFNPDEEDFVHKVIGNYNPQGKGRIYKRKE